MPTEWGGLGRKPRVMAKSQNGGEGEFTEEEAREAGFSSAQEMNDDRAAQEAALGRPPEDDQGD